MCSVLFCSYLLCGLRLSLLSLITSSDSKAFLRFIAFSGSPTVAHHAFPFRLWCEGMAKSKLTFSCALWYYTVGIPLWTSRNRQSQTSKFHGKNTTPCAPTYVITHLPLRSCYREVYGNIACEENGHSCDYTAPMGVTTPCCDKFITLLTFELSSFRENCF